MNILAVVEDVAGALMKYWNDLEPEMRYKIRKAFDE